MDRLSRQELRSLAEQTHEVTVSLYLPLWQTPADVAQNPIRFRHLVDGAEKQLAEEGLRPARIKSLLEPVRELERDAYAWRRSEAEGLAVLLAPESLRVLHLPFACPERFVVGPQFHVAPLIPGLMNNDRFLLLALSPKTVRLYRCTRRDIQLVDTTGRLPRDISEALAGTELEKSLQLHVSALGAPGSRAVMFHGHGAPKDEEKKLLQEFFRIVSRGLESLLHDETTPLIVAAVDYNHALFRETCHYAHLREEFVAGSPDALSEKELHVKAVAAAEPFLAQDLRQAVERYRQLATTERTAHDLKAILPAARDGRVDTLFADMMAMVWGQFDADQATVTIHDARQTGDTELVDLACRTTLLHGGEPYVLPAEQMPEGAQLCAAILRW